MLQIFTLSPQGELTEAEGEVALRSAWRASPHRIWVDIEDPGDSDCELLEWMGFHPAALRDIRTRSRLPKLSHYGDCNFLLLHRVFYSFETETCELREVALFFAPGRIVTVHRRNMRRTFDSVKERVRENAVEMLGESTGFVLLSLLEGLVNDYQPVLAEWQEHLDDVEALILKGTSPESGGPIIDKILKFKKLAMVLRKNLTPQRTVLMQVYERLRPGYMEEASPYFKNVVEEMAALMRELEGLSTHAASIFDIYAAKISLDVSQSSHHLNVVMQRLNIVAAIFLPLTFIVGVYGMNIEGIPELKWKYFYFVLWGVMAVLVLSMLWLFKKMKWY